MAGERRHSRLRPRFTLAALLLLLTFVSLPLAYIAQRRAWNLKRKAAVETLTAKGAGLLPEVFDEFAPAPPAVPPPSGFQKWWRGILLEDAAPRVKEIQFSLTEKRAAAFVLLNDSDLALLTLFPEIEKVEIYDFKSISDRGLAALAALHGQP